MQLHALLLALLPLHAPAGDGSALEVALGAIDARAIAADVRFLAADELGGRDTPSLGLRVAARYLEARARRLGFEPGGDRGYLDVWTLPMARVADGDLELVLLPDEGGERALAFGEDWFLGSYGDVADARAEGGLVYCGTGDRDVLRSLGEERLEGRVALVVDDGSSPLRRRSISRRSGLAGVLVAPAPDAGEPPAERFARVTEVARSGRISGHRDPGDEGRFPQLFLSAAAAAPLLEGAPAVGDELPFRVRHERRVERQEEVWNVCALWPGSDPELRREVVLVSAHFDHVGTRDGDVYNGADDNASGTSALLAVAEGLAAHGPLRRSVLLVWVSGEEKGLLGSRAWVAEPTLPEGWRAVANLNLDMVGRNAPDELLVTPSEELAEHWNGLARRAVELAPLEGFPELESADEYWHRSDHASFAELGIPVCFLFAGVHEDYHRPTDAAEKVDADKVRRVSRLVLRLLASLQDDELEL